LQPALAGAGVRGRWVGGSGQHGARSLAPQRAGWLAAGKRAVGWSRASRSRWARGQAAGDGGGGGSDGDGGRKKKGMALFRRLFYRKPPDRLLEIADRVYGMHSLIQNSKLARAKLHRFPASEMGGCCICNSAQCVARTKMLW
jgi:hypothetical protein